jgi:hypothetical protein
MDPKYALSMIFVLVGVLAGASYMDHQYRNQCRTQCASMDTVFHACNPDVGCECRHPIQKFSVGEMKLNGKR